MTTYKCAILILAFVVIWRLFSSFSAETSHVGRDTFNAINDVVIVVFSDHLLFLSVPSIATDDDVEQLHHSLAITTDDAHVAKTDIISVANRWLSHVQTLVCFTQNLSSSSSSSYGWPQDFPNATAAAVVDSITKWQAANDNRHMILHDAVICAVISFFSDNSWWATTDAAAVAAKMEDSFSFLTSFGMIV